MNLLIKVMQIFIVSAIGFYLYISLVYFLFQPDWFGNNARESFDAITLQHGIFGGGMWSFLSGVLIGIGSLFFEGSNRKWFLFAPIYVPLLYLVAAVTYFGT